MTPSLLSVVLSALREPWAILPDGDGAEYPHRTGAPGRVRYYVSWFGRVAFVAPRAARHRCGLKAVRIEARNGRRPHLRTNLDRGGPHRGRYRTVRVHRLVLAAFPPVAGERLVRHMDGDGTNNARPNLVTGTSTENLRDAYAHGRKPANQHTHRNAGAPPDADPGVSDADDTGCTYGAANGPQEGIPF